MNNTTQQKLQSFINAELGDAALYRELSKYAPDEEDRRLLLEFSADEQAHAEEFQRLYRALYGQSYTPAPPAVKFEGTYWQVLAERILDESRDYRKYGEFYMENIGNEALARAAYRARTDENVHALRIIYMLSKPSLPNK